MRYQIHAIVNFSPQDTDALLRLLAEKAEKLEISTMEKTSKRRGHAHNVRWPRNATITPSLGGVNMEGLTEQQRKAVKLLSETPPKFWPAPKAKVRAVLKPLGTSASPILTQLLDAGLLKVAK